MNEILHFTVPLRMVISKLQSMSSLSTVKCSPECGNEIGYSPLHAAARNGHLAVVKYLIREIGCNPQIADANGNTLLHYACLRGHLDIAKFLI